MPIEYIPFRKTGFFSSFICDYLDEVEVVTKFYNRFPLLQNFKEQIEEKQITFDVKTRKVLTESLKHQYKSLETSELTVENIELLSNTKTFTVTTGHQLNLFTGPLYFLYKIISTINLTEELKQKYPDYNFVPIYWMATEDHDFNEINYFNFQDVKFTWNKSSHGAVGDLSTDGLKEVFDVFKEKLGSSPNAKNLQNLFVKAYVENTNLADGTRCLVNELFKEYGLVIIDANSRDLKKLFVPYLEKEIKQQLSYEEVSRTNDLIEEQGYNKQVNPREINLFYLDKDLRERIIFKNNEFQVNNTGISWTLNEILVKIHKNPEKFSPNVLLRPLYQEVILPNLCYIGGGGELAYWFQLKNYFDAAQIPFPILLLRNSVLIQTQKQFEKLKKLNISTRDLFLDKHSLINKKVREISNIELDFSSQKEHLKNQFKELYKLAEQTDKSFFGAVSAQERKQLKGLEMLEKRLLKAQKRQLSDQVKRVADLKIELFPNENLQERYANFAEFYLLYGDDLIKSLIDSLKPLQSEFLVLTI